MSGQTREHCPCPHMRGLSRERAEVVLAACREAGADFGGYDVFVADPQGLGYGPACHGTPPFEVRRSVHLAMHKAVVVLGFEEATECPSYDVPEVTP